MTNRHKNSSKTLGFIDISIFACTLILCMIIISDLLTVINYNRINDSIITDTKTDTSSQIIYREIPEILNNVSKYVDQTVVVCGYLCTEMGTQSGIAWLTDKPERLRSETNNVLIRLENDEPFEYTAEAIAVQGTLKTVQEEDNSYSLVLINSNFYKYDGENQDFLLHNDLITNDVVNTIAIAVSYDNHIDIEQNLIKLQQIATLYKNEELLKLLKDIDELVHEKSLLNQNDFEEKAEKLWDKFIVLLLNR